MTGLTKSGKCLLELLYDRPAYETCRKQSLAENFRQFLLKFHVRCNQIKKRNTTRGDHNVLIQVAVYRYRNTFAGLPATIAFGGTLLVTVLPAPTIALSPMVRFGRIVAPDPIDAPFLMT